jgi:hypothetical protein
MLPSPPELELEQDVREHFPLSLFLPLFVRSLVAERAAAYLLDSCGIWGQDAVQGTNQVSSKLGAVVVDLEQI